MSSQITVVLVGDFHHPIHEESVAHHLAINGAKVLRVPVLCDLPLSILNYRKWLRRFVPRFYFWLLRTSALRRLKPLVCGPNPANAILFYRCRWIDSSFLNQLRLASAPQVKLVEYNVDNSFGTQYAPSFWRSYNEALALFDICFSIRPTTFAQFTSKGCQHLELLPHMVPDSDFHLGKKFENRAFQVSFLGHFEPDLRTSTLKTLLDAGLKLNIHGPFWEPCSEPKVRALVRPNLPYVQYLDTLSDTQFGLCFLSKLNEDVYTNRVFEIPARGAILVAEYRREIELIYGEDAIYFTTPEECSERIKALQRKSSDELNAMRDRAHQKAKAFRASVGMRHVLDVIKLHSTNERATYISPFAYLHPPENT